MERQGEEGEGAACEAAMTALSAWKRERYRRRHGRPQPPHCASAWREGRAVIRLTRHR